MAASLFASANATSRLTAQRLRVFARPARLGKEKVQGTRASEFLREELGLVPGVLYGGNPKITPPVLLATRQRDIRRELDTRQGSFENTLYNLELEDGTNQLALPRQLQHYVKNIDKYIALNYVRYDPEKGASVKMPFYFDDIEQSLGVKRGGWFNRCLASVWVHVKGDIMPASIRVSVKDLDVGQALRWDDLELPDTIKLVKRNPREKMVTICTMNGKVSLLRAARLEAAAREKASKADADAAAEVVMMAEMAAAAQAKQES